MTIPDASGLNVAAELARLRGDMTTGFAEIKGQLSTIAHAQASHSNDISKLDTRVTALEARRWPIGSVAAVSGAVSAVVAVLALWAGK